MSNVSLFLASVVVGFVAMSLLRPSISHHASGCDQNLWRLIAHPERLGVLSPCVTVTGTVSTQPHLAPDGDLVFAITPDDASMVNAANKTQGGLWIEFVCQGANKSTEAIHRGDCAAFKAAKVAQPKIGQRVSITGAHVKDLNPSENGHLEIHPATSIVIG